VATARTVLLIDDSVGDARLVEITLAQESASPLRLEWVGRISAALERLGRGGVEAVLLDLNLPDSQGVEGLRRIRKGHPGVAVVVHSGSSDPAVRRSALAEGAQEYVVKGVHGKGELARTIRSAIAREALLRTAEVATAPDLEALNLLEEYREGAAIAREGRVVASNARFRGLVGVTAGLAPMLPTWLLEPVTGHARGLEPSVRLRLPAPDGRDPPLELTIARAGPPSSHASAVLTVRREEADPPPRDPPPRGEREVLDPEDWRQLEEIGRGDPTFVLGLIEVFLTEANQERAELERALSEGDLTAARKVGHTLKAAAAQVGARELATLCEALELAPETGIETLRSARAVPLLEMLGVTEKALVERTGRRR
jgi:DNA-binding NarL/FixJ family response regulator/HPt (histidine-containing phosphotransfer) domain-containing protein